jgi:superfamily II DNA/RNA helicase
VRVEPHAAERALYDAVVETFRARAGDPGAARGAATLLLEAGSSPRAVGATVARMRETGSAALGAGADRLAALCEAATTTRKADALVQIARAHAGHVLVFTRFRETLSFAAEVLATEGLRVETFHGGMSAADKKDAVDRFREDGGVMLATDVGAEGQNLQFAAVLVNFDLPWNPMVVEQRIGRLHRMGQEHEVRVYNLCAAGTIEERVLGVLHDRLNLFELVVGEMDMVLGNLADDRDLEERILAVYAGARSDDEVSAGFDRIAEDLAAARLRLDRTKELDEALFGEDYDA